MASPNGACLLSKQGKCCNRILKDKAAKRNNWRKGKKIVLVNSTAPNRRFLIKGVQTLPNAAPASVMVQRSLRDCSLRPSFGGRLCKQTASNRWSLVSVACCLRLFRDEIGCQPLPFGSSRPQPQPSSLWAYRRRSHSCSRSFSLRASRRRFAHTQQAQGLCCFLDPDLLGSILTFHSVILSHVTCNGRIFEHTVFKVKIQTQYIQAPLHLSAGNNGTHVSNT